MEALDAVLPRALEEYAGAAGIGLNEFDTAEDAEVDVALGSEIDDGVGLPHQGIDDGAVADVSQDKSIPVIALDSGQISRISSVGELVQVDDAIGRIPLQQVVDEIAADEAAAAGDENPVHYQSLPERMSVGAEAARPSSAGPGKPFRGTLW